MDTQPSQQVSVLEPIGAAFEKTKQILFQPFDLTKWFTLGFCAWLAMLGDKGGGGGGNFNFQSPGSSGNFQQQFHAAKQEIINNLPIIIAIGISVMIIVLVLSFLFMWLRSRGQFMFLHGVARNVAEVVDPWHRYARQGNSLFLFRIILWLFGVIVGLAMVIPLIFIFIAFAETEFKIFAASGIIGVIFLVPGLVCFGIVMSVINVVTKDFVVPIMYLQDCRVTDGWRGFWQLARVNKMNFFLFLLVLLVLNIAIGIILMFIVLLTCCCAGCIFAIPYLGTVVLLPLYVWRRAYSALFLAQFGPEYDVFPKVAEVVVPANAAPPAGPMAPPPPEQNF